ARQSARQESTQCRHHQDQGAELVVKNARETEISAAYSEKCDQTKERPPDESDEHPRQDPAADDRRKVERDRRLVQEFVVECCGQRMQMQKRSFCFRAKRRIKNVMRHLRGGANYDDFVFEKRTVLVIRMPTFRIENLPKWSWHISVNAAKAKQVGLQITRHVGGMPKFLEGPCAERFVGLFVRLGQLILHLQISHGVAHGPDFAIQRIGEKNS